MPRTDQPHPDFTRAAPELRWTGKLPELFRQLRNAAVMQPGAWHMRVLPGGAWVGLHYDASRDVGAGLTLRIQRSEAGHTADADRLFRQEVATFARKFRVAGWETTFGTHPGGGPRATLRPPIAFE
ncbi:MAG: hypothetical protein AB1941_10005 [Gemmatimonadota bacterium]